jgi:hypothetical protein
VVADVRAGAAAAVGVIPAAVFPLAPRRLKRATGAVLGALTGVSVLIGSLLAVTPWLADGGGPFGDHTPCTEPNCSHVLARWRTML